MTFVLYDAYITTDKIQNCDIRIVAHINSVVDISIPPDQTSNISSICFLYYISHDYCLIFLGFLLK